MPFRFQYILKLAEALVNFDYKHYLSVLDSSSEAEKYYTYRRNGFVFFFSCFI